MLPAVTVSFIPSNPQSQPGTEVMGVVLDDGREAEAWLSSGGHRSLGQHSIQDALEVLSRATAMRRGGPSSSLSAQLQGSLPSPSSMPPVLSGVLEESGNESPVSQWLVGPNTAGTAARPSFVAQGAARPDGIGSGGAGGDGTRPGGNASGFRPDELLRDPFRSDNRLGLSGLLHRISCIRDLEVGRQ